MLPTGRKSYADILSNNARSRALGRMARQRAARVMGERRMGAFTGMTENALLVLGDT